MTARLIRDTFRQRPSGEVDESLGEEAQENVESEAQQRARRIMRAVTRKSVRYGGESREKVMRVPFAGGPDDPRNLLIEALATAVGDDHAIAIADALDAYLATDPADRTPARQWQPPDHRAELDEAIKQRDEAVARAEKAEQRLVKGKKKPVGVQQREELRTRTAARRSLIR